jgi:hypothetical protein
MEGFAKHIGANMGFGEIPSPRTANAHKYVRIVNLTPHPIRLYARIGDEDIFITEFPPSGIVARCEEIVENGEPLCIDGCRHPVPVVAKRLGQVQDLPAPKYRTRYIVSLAVAQAARDRDDLLIPDDLVRDGQGRVIGCRRFAVVA